MKETNVDDSNVIKVFSAERVRLMVLSLFQKCFANNLSEKDTRWSDRARNNENNSVDLLIKVAPTK